MRSTIVLLGVAVAAAGCTTRSTVSRKDPTGESTTTLCRLYAEHPDLGYREKVKQVLVKRGASPEKCARLVAADNRLAASIAIAGAAGVAAAAAANNGFGGGGYYPSSPSYGVAWDQFHYQGRSMWRCRDRSSGRFVFDHYCAGLPMNDFEWPGPLI